ncbi:hypothetical protein ACCO45_003826 [Purpureocillium lilacinum]|uniref:Uncharacterized protein n=1 Tax=Purpureocillium lilacinum TaxID=33203 RepID=A0ACC4E458_PURLI
MSRALAPDSHELTAGTGPFNLTQRHYQLPAQQRVSIIGPPPGTRAKRPDRQHRPDSLRGPQPGSTWLEDSKLCLTPLSRRTVPIVGRKASCLDEHTIWTRVNKAGPAWQHLATKHRLVAHPCQANAGLPTRDVVRRQPDSGTRCPVAPFVLEDS